MARPWCGTTLSSEDHTRRAELAWASGDRPGEPAFAVAVAEPLRERLTALLPTEFSTANGVFRALAPPQGVCGRYLLEAAGERWFLRVSSRLGEGELERAILDHLSDGGVAVNPILHTVLREVEGERLRVDLRPFVAARHYSGDERELLRLARLLAHTHRRLRGFPRAAEVRERARRRGREFAEARRWLGQRLAAGDTALFHEQASWAARHFALVRAVVDEVEPEQHRLAGAQCLHGEVHPGNVLFTDDGPLLLDFEESVYRFAPPAWDLAFLVQRFCLADDPSSEVLARRLDIVRRGYGELPPLASSMRQIALHSLLFMIEARARRALHSPDSEYGKFTRLARQARALEGVV